MFGNIGGTPLSVPEYLTDPAVLRPKLAPPGDWRVLIMSNRKNFNQERGQMYFHYYLLVT